MIVLEIFHIDLFITTTARRTTTLGHTSLYITWMESNVKHSSFRSLVAGNREDWELVLLPHATSEEREKRWKAWSTWGVPDGGPPPMATLADSAASSPEWLQWWCSFRDRNNSAVSPPPTASSSHSPMPPTCCC
ncbi:unnamed protein product, partial [Musa banksii]